MCRGTVTLRFAAASAACFRSHANLSAAVCVLRELLIVRTKSAAPYSCVRTENPAPFRRQDANTPSSRPEVRTENAESFPVSRAVRAAAHPGVRTENPAPFRRQDANTLGAYPMSVRKNGVFLPAKI